MREIYLSFLNQKKDEKRLSYDELAPKTNMSKSKLQRIFTGQTEPTVSDLEILVEKGLGANIDELYAIVGESELKASEDIDYKGAQALLADFAAEKAQIHENYKTNIQHLVAKSDERQQIFTDTLKLIGDQYRANVEFLIGINEDNKARLVDLLAKTEHANAMAVSEQKRAEEAEKRVVELDKRRYQVFWSMLGVIVLLLLIIVISIVFDIPAFNWGNGVR